MAFWFHSHSNERGNDVCSSTDRGFYTLTAPPPPPPSQQVPASFDQAKPLIID